MDDYCSQAYYARHSTPFIRLCSSPREDPHLLAKYRSRIFVFKSSSSSARVGLLGRPAQLWKARLIPCTR